MSLEQLGTGNAGVATTDGNVIPGNLKIGASGSKLGFYGLATIIAKPSVTQQTTATTTALRADINRINTALSNLGLITVT